MENYRKDVLYAIFEMEVRMSKLRVIMLRTNKVDPDPRVEKEVNSLLLNNNVHIEVLAWDRTEKYEYKKGHLKLQNGCVTIHRIGILAGWGIGIKKNAKAYISYVWKTSKWLRKNVDSYDCIHACDLQTVIPALWIILFYKKKKFVYDIFDYFSDTAHGNSLILWISRKFETFIINHADATIICSEKRKKQINPAKPKKLYVIHNSPSINQISTDISGICKSNSNKTKIVYVGNLVEDRCIREIIYVAKENREIEFHIGGIGNLSEFVNEVSSKYSNVFYYGKLQYKEVLALEKECDIMIALYDQNVRNHKYAAPNKFYEAMALGKPLIVLHDTGIDDIVDEYKLGISVNQSTYDISQGIKKLIEDQDNWTKMKIEGKSLFEQKYSWDIMEVQLNELYTNL